MDLLQLGTQLLSDQLGPEVDPSNISSALTGLLGGSGGKIDFAALASKMASNGELGNIVSSWLGDGANSAISADSIMGLFGDANVADFAAKLGTNTDSAASGLADVLPQIVDQGSSA